MAHKDTIVGHIHLTVSDLDRSLAFYRDLLGFEISARYGDSAAFLSAGGYHHHIGLNTWSGKGARSAPRGYAGMYHVAFLYPSRKELAKVLQKLIDTNYPLEGSADHGVSEAIYLRDPDDNGVELYVDRPRKEWKVRNDGMVEMVTEPLNLQSILQELST
ncbi:MAG: VOC family protein [Candidatus Pacebacteria bacterium]|nr:VOC family protein [Candidatus Paceibacterota bacterium]